MTSENQNSPSSQEHPAQPTQETQTQIAKTATELQSPAAQPECEDSRKEKKHWLDYVTFVLELLGLIVLCVYAGYTIKIYCANKQAADAARNAANAATQQTTLLRQQIVGTMAAYFTLNGPELVGDKVRVGWARSGQVKSPRFHATFRISLASFPRLKETWRSDLYEINLSPASDINDKYRIPEFAAADRQFVAQKQTIIVKGTYDFDNGFGEVFSREFCSVYFGMYQYTAIHDAGVVTQGGFQDCGTLQEKLRQFRNHELP